MGWGDDVLGVLITVLPEACSSSYMDWALRWFHCLCVLRVRVNHRPCPFPGGHFTIHFRVQGEQCSLAAAAASKQASSRRIKGLFGDTVAQNRHPSSSKQPQSKCSSCEVIFSAVSIALTTRTVGHCAALWTEGGRLPSEAFQTVPWRPLGCIVTVPERRGVRALGTCAANGPHYSPSRGNIGPVRHFWGIYPPTGSPHETHGLHLLSHAPLPPRLEGHNHTQCFGCAPVHRFLGFASVGMPHCLSPIMTLRDGNSAQIALKRRGGRPAAPCAGAPPRSSLRPDTGGAATHRGAAAAAASAAAPGGPAAVGTAAADAARAAAGDVGVGTAGLPQTAAVVERTRGGAPHGAAGGPRKAWQAGPPPAWPSGREVAAGRGTAGCRGGLGRRRGAPQGRRWGAAGQHCGHWDGAAVPGLWNPEAPHVRARPAASAGQRQ